MRRAAWLGVLAALLTAAPLYADDLLSALRADPEAQQAALTLARSALDAWCLRRERIAVPNDLPPLLQERSGAFVSAILGDAPRCCMGSLYPTKRTLAEEIIGAAVAAAGMDLRFPPLTPDLLVQLRVIVSVVDPPELTDDPMALDPMADGVAVRSALRWGVSLPGETPHQELMIKWARIRAGAAEDEPVEYYRVRAVRVMEP